MDTLIKKYECNLLEKEFQHKKRLNQAHFYLDVFLSIYDRISPVLNPFIYEWLKSKLIQYNHPRKTWQDFINLKRAF